MKEWKASGVYEEKLDVRIHSHRYRLLLSLVLEQGYCHVPLNIMW